MGLVLEGCRTKIRHYLGNRFGDLLMKGVAYDNPIFSISMNWM